MESQGPAANDSMMSTRRLTQRGPTPSVGTTLHLIFGVRAVLVKGSRRFGTKDEYSGLFLVVVFNSGSGPQFDSDLRLFSPR